ncbi:MAG: WD repeat-containing protein 61 [Bacteroidia bacterium]|jgi:WD repeat-containing protein 61
MINIEKKNELNGHIAPIYALCADEKNFIYSGGVDRQVIRWDIEDLDNSKIITKSSEAIYSLFHYADNNLLFVGTSTGKIHVVDINQKKEIKLLKNHTDKIFDFKLFGSNLIAVSADGSISFTNLNNLKTEQILNISNGRIRSIDIKDNIAAIACGNSNIVMIDLINKTILKSFMAHTKSCNVVRFHPTDNLLLSGGWDAHLNIWNEDYEKQTSIPAHNYAIYSIAFSPDNKLFATGSRDKTIKIWDAINPESPKSITYENLGGHQFSVNRLIWNQKNDVLISASDDKKIMIWSIDHELKLK